MVGSIGRLSERAPVGRRPPRTSQVKSRPSLKFIRGFSLFTRGRVVISASCFKPLCQRRISTKKLEDRALGSWGFIIGLY